MGNVKNFPSSISTCSRLPFKRKGREDLKRVCRNIGNSAFRCGPEELYKKAEKIKWHYELKTIKARITKYSPVESCHYPKWVWNKRECLTASGNVAIASRTVACPSYLHLGTTLRIGGRSYVCEDRTAKWVQTKFKYPTLDIFTKSQKEAINFGARYEEITIME